MKIPSLKWWVLGALASTVCFGYQISAVKISGNDNAELRLLTDGIVESLPQPSASDNSVELLLPAAELHSSLRGQVDLASPHALISRVQMTPEKNGVRLKVTVNGAAENLKGRTKLTRDESGLKLNVEPPKARSATLSLLKEEQAPLGLVTTEKKATAPPVSMGYFLLIGALLAIAAGATAFLYVTLRRKGRIRGQRKFLIEQLAYCSLGNRSGVSLVKVGKEFVLVGVTPQNVTLLSSLPALQAQYEEESRFERETFHEAVSEEITRLKAQVAV